MIKSLSVKNYALIDVVEINFSSKLTIITGETGAGKSILLGALGLIMGERAESKVLYDENEKCIIEGTFDIKNYDLKSYFETHDLDYEDTIIIRREITPQGKSRAFINDVPVNLTQLKEVTSALVDLHQQFDTADINQVSYQLRMLDALANNKSTLETYHEHFSKFKKADKQLKELIEKRDTASKEASFIQFQLEEFSHAALVAGEQNDMETELNMLSNAELIKKNILGAVQGLTDADKNILTQLKDVSGLVNQIKKYNPHLDDIAERIQNILIEIDDLSTELDRIGDKIEYNPTQLDKLQLRLDIIYKLQKKHHVNTVEALIEIQQNLESQLSIFENVDENIVAKQVEMNLLTEKLENLSNLLHKTRIEVAPGFQSKVEKMLASLGMENAQLKIEMNPLAAFSTQGKDDVKYMFSANKGSKLQLIKDVASGGELSRLTLCTKSLVASAIPLPTLIFDEIDSGVSGEVAGKMGGILKNLAAEHQVIVITHSPQVASKADAHFYVYKNIKDDRTQTKIRELTSEEQVKSIAVMLSGNPPSNSAIENAKELIAS